MWKKVRVSPLERSPSAKCTGEPRPVAINREGGGEVASSPHPVSDPGSALSPGPLGGKEVSGEKRWLHALSSFLPPPSRTLSIGQGTHPLPASLTTLSLLYGLGCLLNCYLVQLTSHSMQAYLRDTAGPVPAHQNKVSIPIKQAVILLVEVLPSVYTEMQHL